MSSLKIKLDVLETEWKPQDMADNGQKYYDTVCYPYGCCFRNRS
jgi:hypothetical protein